MLGRVIYGAVDEMDIMLEGEMAAVVIFHILLTPTARGLVKVAARVKVRL